VTVAIVAILIGTLAFSIGAARQYLDGQLQSESENAVRAGLVAVAAGQPGPVTQELLMMALFDGGQFKLISLAGTEGQTCSSAADTDTRATGGPAVVCAPAAAARRRWHSAPSATAGSRWAI
jgi:hypothetical protein